MATLPSSQDLGVVIPQSQRPVGGYDAGVAGRAAAQGGAQLERVGEETTALGQTIQQTQDHLAYASGISAIYQAKVAADQKYKDDPDYATAPQRYSDELSKQADQISGTIRNPTIRADFEALVARRVVADGTERLQNISESRALDAGKAWVLQTIDGNIDSAVKSPDPTTRAGLLDAISTTLKTGVDKHYISAVEAQLLSRNAGVKFAEAFGETFADPWAKRNYYAGGANGGVPPAPLAHDLDAGITAANTAHPGLPPAFLRRTAQLEGSGSANPPDSSAGAAGPFQMMRTTASAVGIADPRNSGQAAEGTARLAERNQAQMADILGRAPTEEELYLAHQQGGAGAIALIQNPTMSAVDALTKTGMKPSTAQAAIIGNGGHLDQTAGDFAAMWAKRYDNVPAGAPSGTPAPQEGQPYQTDESGRITFRKTGSPADLLPDSYRVQQIVQADNEIRTEQARAREEQLRANAQNRADAEDTMRDEVAKVADTGKGQTVTANYLASIGYTPKEVDVRMRQYQHAYDLYTTDKEVGLSSRADDQKILDAGATADPNAPTEGYGDARQMAALKAKMVAEKWKQIGEDSGGYLARHAPDFATALAAATQDPSKMQAAVSLADQYFDKIQVPPEQRQYLPKDDANNLVKNLMSEPADKRAEAVEGMAQGYGTAWPKVYGAMVKAGLPSGYQVLPLIGSSSQRIALANVLGPNKDQVMKAIPEATRQQIDRDVESNTDMALLGKTMAYASGGGDSFSNIKEGVKQLAYGLAWQGDSDPVGHAAAALTTDRYDFGDTYRVPKGKLDEMGDRSAQLFASLKKDDLQPLGPGSSTGLTPERLQEITRQNATGGQWRTNETDTGLVWFGANGYPVMLKNGQRLEMPFETPASYAAPGVVVPLAGRPGFSGRPTGARP